MVFKPKLNFSSFYTTAASVKQWAVREAAGITDSKSQDGARAASTPGAYALLVGFNHRGL